MQKEKQFTDYNAFNIYGTYKFDLNKDHHFSVMAGFNQESKYTEGVNVLSYNQAVVEVPALGSGTGDLKATDSYNEYSVRGGFFRVNYNYMDKYLLEVNGRYDGSSKFPKDSRFGFFPSVSLGWNVAQEKFMEVTRNYIDGLKIRASYGVIGNQNVNPYTFTPTMSVSNKSTSWIIDNTYVTSISSLPALVSQNFTWEKVQTKNIGFDFTLLRNRLSGSFDYYIRDTKDMIVGGFKLPAILGTGSPNRNAADLRTKGFEFEVSWNDRIGKDFTYRVGFNLSDSQAKITKYDLNPDGNIGDHYVGEKIGEIWGFVTDGFYSTDEEAAGVDNSDIWGGKWLAGDVRYKNLNGDKTADGKDIISKGHSKLQDPGDRKIIGNNTARYNYGISLSAEYKNFDFSCLMQGVGKRDLMLGGAYFWGFTDEWRTPTTEQLDYWTPDNPNAYYPRQRFGGGGNFQSQTKYLQNGAYMRMKQLTLGYSIPKALLSKVRINSLRFYFTGQNLFEFTKMIKSYDPEQPDRKGDYPLDRAFSFGVQVSL